MICNQLKVFSKLSLGLVIIIICLLMFTIKLDEDAESQLYQLNREIYATPKVGSKQMFFVEASCAVMATEVPMLERVIRLKPGQACALESAARSNPETPIYLYHVCPIDEWSFGRSSQMVKDLFNTYDNLYVLHETVENLAKGSPVEKLYNSSDLATSEHRIIHVSDMLRLLLLWKYGGTYLDLDFIVIRSLDSLAPDSVEMESEVFANNAAIRLRSEGIGHKFAEKCLQEMPGVFPNPARVDTGPGLFSKILPNFCGMDKLRPTKPEECSGFVIYPPKNFYPLPYWEWRRLFNGTHGVNQTMEDVQKSYAIHIWGSMLCLESENSVYRTIDRDGETHPKALLAKMHCPLSYEIEKHP